MTDHDLKLAIDQAFEHVQRSKEPEELNASREHLQCLRYAQRRRVELSTEPKLPGDEFNGR